MGRDGWSVLSRTPASHHSSLDWQLVAQAVQDRAIGHPFIYLPSTASTNDVARDLAARGAAEGAAVFADEQTAGRGRAGKLPWRMPGCTSLALSLLLRPRLAPAELPCLSMGAGVAAVESINSVAGITAALKWPNDVLARGRKLGGILVEAAISGSSVAHAILGIGVNGNFPATALGPLPDAALPPTTLQDEAGRPISREELLITLLRTFDGIYAALQSGQGASIRQRYRAHLSILGHWVRLHAADGPIDGVAEDVTSEGALILRLASGARRYFTYGEVSLRLRE